MIFTHNHLDHYNPQTVSRFITAGTNIVVLAPASVWNEARKIGKKYLAPLPAAYVKTLHRGFENIRPAKTEFYF